MGRALAAPDGAAVTPAVEARVLAVSDQRSDAELVQRLLSGAFPLTSTSHDPQRHLEDYERVQPQVLVLAFKSLSDAELYYLGLYRHSKVLNTAPHRVLLLCTKADAQRAYELCRRDYFDDYVLFWPLAHDAGRLPMSVHVALRELHAAGAAAPLAQLSAQARRIAELEQQLEQQITIGTAHAERAQAQVERARLQVGEALDGLAGRLLDGAGPVTHDAPRLHSEVARVRDAALPPLGQAAAALQPVQRWIGTLKSELDRPLQAARRLAEQARQLAPVLQVVDDDPFLRKTLQHVLGSVGYTVQCADSGAEALRLVGRRRPQLILMDFRLPDIDGIEVTRRLKAIPAYADIPVIMVTARSERTIIVDSLEAGAAGFVVKPFERDLLLKKVEHFLGGQGEG